MMKKDENLLQKKLEAKLQAEINARKSRNVVKAGSNLASQWGKIVMNEQSLIDRDHYIKK